MRTTITLDDDLLATAIRLTGITDRTPLIRESLKAIIAREASRRLALLGGSMPDIELTPRRRPDLEPEPASKPDVAASGAAAKSPADTSAQANRRKKSS